MNLCEARKLAHEGWVRRPGLARGRWIRPDGSTFFLEDGTAVCSISSFHLDVDDWEPRPTPDKETSAKPFETEVWVSLSGNLVIVGADSEDRLARAGWRKIRVREVVE